MKQLTRYAVLLFGMAFLLASCQKAPFVTLNTPRSFTFSRDGGTQDITFTCNRDWSVSSSEPWIQVSPSSGTTKDGEVTVVITCAANTTYDPRSAIVTIKVEELSEAVTISQETGLGLIVSPTNIELTCAAQSIEIEVRKNVQYTVAIDNACVDWIKQGGTKALTTDKITFSISANTSYDDREGKIVFKQLDGNLSETVVVRQSQTDAMFIATTEYSLSNDAHTLSVEVKTNVHYDVIPQVDWINVVETKALVSSTIVLMIEPNKSYQNRTGSVLVKQANGNLTKTINVFQKQTDVLMASPTIFEISNQEQTIDITINTNVSYVVDIPKSAKSWVKVNSSPSPMGYQAITVNMGISQNAAYNSRETILTIRQTNGDLKEQIQINQQKGDGIVDLGLPSGKKWALYPLGASSEYSYARSYSLLKDANITDTYGYSGWNHWYFGGTPYTNISGTENDPAQSLGEKWHTPTINEFLELENNCTFESFVYEGNDYVRATSKINGNSVVFVSSFWNKQRSNQYPVLYWASDIYVYEGYYFAPYFFFPVLNWQYGFSSTEYYSGEIPENLYDSYDRVISVEGGLAFILPVYY